MKLIFEYGSAKMTIEVPDGDEPNEDLTIIHLRKYPSKIKITHSEDDGYLFEGTYAEFRRQVPPNEKRKLRKQAKEFNRKVSQA